MDGFASPFLLHTVRAIEAAQRKVRSDRRADIEACTRVMREAERLPDEERVAGIVEACKNLWINPDCRDAWSDALSQPPEVRGESVIRRCAAAECPTLDVTVELCQQDLAGVNLLDPAPDWSALWKEFNRVVLARDLGLQPDDTVGAIIAMRLLQLVAISGGTPHEGKP
mgnify:FL=1